MAKSSGFFTERGPDGAEQKEGPAISRWYTQGVSSTRQDDMAGTTGWPFANENPSLSEKLNMKAFEERQGMIANYLKAFKGNALAQEFLSNMGGQKTGYPRLGKDGALCGVSLIVVHYTGSKTKKPALYSFEKATVDEPGGKNINKGAHFLIDENGKVIQLAPIEAIVMHAKGFNLSSIGIEIASESEGRITPAQVAAAISLCERLMSEHPQIAYVAGHCELMDKKKPYRDKFHVRPNGDSRYDPEGKPDPGIGVMDRIRAGINADINGGKLPGCRLVGVEDPLFAGAQNRRPAHAGF